MDLKDIVQVIDHIESETNSRVTIFSDGAPHGYIRIRCTRYRFGESHHFEMEFKKPVSDGQIEHFIPAAQRMLYEVIEDYKRFKGIKDGES